MHYRTYVILFFVMLISASTFSQNKRPFGNITTEENNLKVYEKDSSATAVVLAEYGDYFFAERNDYMRLIKRYHVRIKILDKNGLDQANIEIPLYRTSKRYEKIEEIKAVTYTNGKRYSVDKNQIFDVDESEHWTAKKFTFPNVEVGSIIEYSYQLQSPFLYNLDGWSFQSEIPKVYSEFNAKILRNYIYNRALKGPLRLEINEATIEPNCVYISGYDPGACEALKYVMKDIPAFKQEERFMLAPKNYISKLEFELAEYLHFNGQDKDKYAKSWKDVDRDYKRNQNLGFQLRKKNFFEKNVPNSLFEGTDREKAEKIYHFVRDHYQWNQKYEVRQKSSVKEAFNNGIGNVAEINISLINLLNNADIPSQMALVSTRNNGLPKTDRPVITDFNYLVAHTVVDGDTLLLDATDKQVPFGMLPYRSLNYFARVMDFKKGSYWMDIRASDKNSSNFRSEINIDTKTGSVTGRFDHINLGYMAIEQRKYREQFSEEAYIARLEKGNLLVNSYSTLDEKNTETSFTERYTFELEDAFEGDKLYLNPIMLRYFSSNPLKLEERNYPVDFGFSRAYRYLVNITIPEGMKVKQLPKAKTIVLENGEGKLKFNCAADENKIALILELRLSRPHYSISKYGPLKQVFNTYMDLQNKTIIEFEKI